MAKVKNSDLLKKVFLKKISHKKTKKRMQQPPQLGLPGAKVSHTIVMQELNAAKVRVHLGDCFQRCVTHFDEDSLPHHPGEKVCMDRCFAKLGASLELSKDAKKKFDERAKDFSEQSLPKWIKTLDDEHRVNPRKNF